MKTKASNFIKLFLPTLALILWVFPLFISHAQPVSGPPPASKGNFHAPRGVPNQQNVPDQSGRFSTPQRARRNPGQLMESNDMYPPPGVRKVLWGLAIAAVIAIYFLFMRGKMGNLFPALGDFILKKLMASESGMKLDESRRDPVEEALLEFENKEASGSFRPFRLSRAFSAPIPAGEFPFEIKLSEPQVVISDSPGELKRMAFRLVKKFSRANCPLLFLSPRISMSDLAEGILQLETGKTWQELDEPEKYRLDRQVEEFMDSYRNVLTYPAPEMNDEKIRDILNQARAAGDITAVVIDRLNQGEPDGEVLETLKAFSRKDSFPVFILLESGN